MCFSGIFSEYILRKSNEEFIIFLVVTWLLGFSHVPVVEMLHLCNISINTFKVIFLMTIRYGVSTS